MFPFNQKLTLKAHLFYFASLKIFEVLWSPCQRILLVELVNDKYSHPVKNLLTKESSVGTFVSQKIHSLLLACQVVWYCITDTQSVAEGQAVDKIGTKHQIHHSCQYFFHALYTEHILTSKMPITQPASPADVLDSHHWSTFDPVLVACAHGTHHSVRQPARAKEP